MLHDGRQVLGLFRFPSDAENTDTIESPDKYKEEEYQQNNEYRYTVDAIVGFYSG
jgi:hypothetical protein